MIFQSQYLDLKKAGVEIGVLSADTARTLQRYPGVKCFDVSKGRLKAVVSAVIWSDIVVVGGGELVQDVSSLFYSPFNLLPLFLAFLLRKKSFGWAVGIGQARELTFATGILTKLALKTTRGFTVRDRGSYNTLHQLGLREPKMMLASDCALTLSLDQPEKAVMIGAAPRDVSNRSRHLLPLELRKKLGIYKPVDPAPAAIAWARLLDWYSKKFSAGIVLFPFHTGTLSNDDHLFCMEVVKRMKMKNSATVADSGNTDEFLRKLSMCRVMVTTPLHGAILALAAGTIPVSVPYSSKCSRFMEQAELSEFISTGRPGIPDKSTAAALERAWTEFDSMKDSMAAKRGELMNRAGKTYRHFRETFRL